MNMILPKTSFLQRYTYAIANKLLIKVISFLLLVLACNSEGAIAQTLRTYESKIVTSDNRPVAGATVQNTNKVTTTTTNQDGIFTIQAATGDSLKITATGFKTMVYAVPEGEGTQPKIVLTGNDEVAVTTAPPVQRIYTTVPASLNLASNGAVYSSDLIKTPTSTFRNSLTGRLAGLYNLQSSGLPGADGAGFSVRGQAPVVIIDGVVANLTQFDLEEIESVTVLKDAVGTGMLGVRGSGGAIVVTTKKGKADKQLISFTAQSAIQQTLGAPKTLDAFNYASLYNEARVNDGLTPLYPDSVLQFYKDGTNPQRYPNVNYRDAITKKTSNLNRYTLSATGGNRFARYYVALEHLNQDGFFKTADSNSYNTNNNFKSYVIRSNIDVSITSKLTAGIYVLGRILSSTEPGAGTNIILSNLINTPANAYPLLNPNGSFGGTAQFQNNVLAQTVGSGYLQNYKRDMLINIYLRRTLDEVTPGLWMQAKAAYYNTISENQNRAKSFAVFQQTTTGGAYTTFGVNGTQNNFQSLDYQGRTDYEEFSVGYDRIFDKVHGINALVLANRDNYTLNFNLPYTIVGSSGRVAYNYKGKYVVEGVFAVNGSNRYPNNGATKPGFFPSVGLGWNLEQESFIQKSTWLSRLKLFGSYGRTGNDNPGYFVYYQRYFDGVSVPFGTGAASNTGITEQPLANRNITFEKAGKLNVGIDGAVLNNRLGFTVEYFKNRFSDILMQRGRNTTLIGNTYPDENIGINRYEGWEAQLSWRETAGAFQYFVAANASTVQSKVLYMDEVFQRYDWMKRTGQPVGQSFGYVAEGLYQNAAEVASHANIDGLSPKPGDIKYKDLNSDGVINQFDIAAIGNTKPLFYYGLTLGASYKGFDISALIQGVQNRSIYLAGGSYWAFQNNGLGQAYEHNLDRWTPATAATATYPRVNVGTNDNNQAFSSFWMRDGSYLRLKNAEIGYSLPQSLIGKIKLQTIRVFANGYNLLTKTSSQISGRDPEIFNSFSYPNQRVFNFGVNIKF